MCEAFVLLYQLAQQHSRGQMRMKDNIYYLHFLENYVSMLQKQQTQIQEESRQVNGALDTLLKAGDVR